KNIGPYDYKKLANIQSKTIFGGMENAGAIFYFENSVIEKGIESLMAHEIAHQWFGDAVSEKNFHHLWLSEGFATYLTNHYLEIKYGVDSLQALLTEQRAKIFKFEKERLKPVVDTSVNGNYMPLLNPNSYEKGGWVLHMLRRKIGDGAFFKGLNTYYLKYRRGNAETDDFMEVMQNISGQKLQSFFDQWLRTAGHPDLGIKWLYDTKTRVVDVVVNQKQNTLYTFPLELTIDGQPHTINITGKTTTVHIAAGKKAPVVKVDPNVNLLASFTVTSE
ncbi:MAG: M1 family aminopeptidase, partial [Bacteroidota bacterium]